MGTLEPEGRREERELPQKERERDAEIGATKAIGAELIVASRSSPLGCNRNEVSFVKIDDDHSECGDGNMTRVPYLLQNLGGIGTFFFFFF